MEDGSLKAKKALSKTNELLSSDKIKEMAMVHNLLLLDLHINFLKDKERAKCSTEAKYERFARDVIFRKTW